MICVVISKNGFTNIKQMGIDKNVAQTEHIRDGEASFICSFIE